MSSVTPLTYGKAQNERRRLIDKGIPHWRVNASSNLNDLEAEFEQLTLVPSIVRPALTIVPGTEETPDEAFSTRFARARMAGVTVPEFDQNFDGLGGDAA